MDMYRRYVSPLGYRTANGSNIDSYGVDHSGFSTRDEIEYQMARQDRENDLIDQMKKQGLNSYTQYGKNFWGDPADNYGLGNFNISDNIANLNRRSNQGVQYAQNNLPNVVSDVLPSPNPTPNPSHISDEDLYEKMWTNIKKLEGVEPYPYLDTKGNITVGGGSNINNYDDFMRTKFMIDGCPASDAQKKEAYEVLRALSNEKDNNGNYLHANKLATFFKDKTKLRVTDAYSRSMAQNHMTQDLNHVRKEFSDFDNLPLPLKEVLLDIQYNVGGITKTKWPNLYAAIANRDVDGIIKNVHRKDIGQDRNDWAERMARSIRF